MHPSALVHRLCKIGPGSIHPERTSAMLQSVRPSSLESASVVNVSFLNCLVVLGALGAWCSVLASICLLGHGFAGINCDALAGCYGRPWVP